VETAGLVLSANERQSRLHESFHLPISWEGDWSWLALLFEIAPVGSAHRYQVHLMIASVRNVLRMRRKGCLLYRRELGW
jgi:hypothetical protein